MLILSNQFPNRLKINGFASSILREEVVNWFQDDVNSPYMSFVAKFRENMVDKVPAVFHKDNIARLQPVTEKDNFWYYNFIKRNGLESQARQLVRLTVFC